MKDSPHHKLTNFHVVETEAKAQLKAHGLTNATCHVNVDWHVADGKPSATLHFAPIPAEPADPMTNRQRIARSQPPWSVNVDLDENIPLRAPASKSTS